MQDSTQRVLAVWAVLVVPFVVLSVFLWRQNELSARIVAVYWYPAVVLVLIGTIPAPWEPLVG